MVLNKTNEAVKPKLACMERGPGPAKYYIPGTCGTKSHDPTKRTRPAYSFGIKHRQHNDFGRSPGPVYFVPPNLTKKGLEGIPSYSITGRRRSFSLPTAPGPGDNNTCVCMHLIN